MTKNSLDVLNQLQNSEIGSYEHFEQVYASVLSLDVYLTIEKRRKEKRENLRKDLEGDLNSTAHKEDKLLAECEHIHNKVLFDCINDSLVQFKPYGKETIPMPWSKNQRKLRL